MTTGHCFAQDLQHTYTPVL